MKKSICVYFLLLFFYLFPLTSYADITTGLVGWWKFEEGSGLTANDSSGQGNTGTLKNSPTWITGCPRNNCLNFNQSSSQYVSISENNQLPIYKNYTAYSVSFWENPIFSSGPMGVVQELGSSTVFRIGQKVVGYVWINIVNDAGTTLLSQNSTTALSGNNTWHHIVWVDNNGTAKLYIDGILDATNFNYTRSGTFNNLNTDTIAYTASGDYFYGAIDDVRIYNRSLSAQDVYTLYVGGNRIRSGVIRKYQAKN